MSLSRRRSPIKRTLGSDASGAPRPLPATAQPEITQFRPVSCPPGIVPGAGKVLVNTNLSHVLSLKLGRGFSRPNLNNMRKFSSGFKNSVAESRCLTSNFPLRTRRSASLPVESATGGSRFCATLWWKNVWEATEKLKPFYLAYPNCQNVSDKLNWSQICELITVSAPLERSFYEKECVREGWDVLALRRQMDSVLFLRIICPTGTIS